MNDDKNNSDKDSHSVGKAIVKFAIITIIKRGPITIITIADHQISDSNNNNNNKNDIYCLFDNNASTWTPQCPMI